MFGWIKSLLTPARKVSSLAVEGDAVEVTRERVDTSGKPLKEGHLRRAWRDERLLPKRNLRRAVGMKPKQWMTRAEADRLFSNTMRTRNRKLRDVTLDEEHLQRLGLPVWRTEEDVAAALGISLRELRFYSVHRERDRFFNYVCFAFAKRTGGHRIIMAPKRRLKAIQRALLPLLIEKLPVAPEAHGFRAGRSTRTNAEPHVGHQLVVRIDLKNFFPTVTFARVRGFLISLGYGFPVATVLACLMTEAERQPVELDDGSLVHVPVTQRYCVQGAPTSPGLCNAMVLKLDHRLAGLARKMGWTYTRYADDLTFSGDQTRGNASALCGIVRRIVEEEGFIVNSGKTLIQGSASCQKVTGVVVNEVLGLSRTDRRRLRAMLHRTAQGREAHDGSGKALTAAQVQGKLAYLRMLNAAQADAVKSGRNA